MSRLADDLLVLARADQGRLPLHAKRLAARKLLEDAAGRARASADVRGRSITVGEVPNGCAVRADPDRAAQALDNLITNAVLYGQGTITLSVTGSGENAELHGPTRDTGFRRTCCHEPSSGSDEANMPAQRSRAAVSGWRWWRLWRSRTAATRRLATARRAARMSRSRCHAPR